MALFEFEFFPLKGNLPLNGSYDSCQILLFLYSIKELKLKLVNGPLLVYLLENADDEFRKGSGCYLFRINFEEMLAIYFPFSCKALGQALGLLLLDGRGEGKNPFRHKPPHNRHLLNFIESHKRIEYFLKVHVGLIAGYLLEQQLSLVEIHL